ncbi:hypothetical protein [Hymenobacter cellulosivorans]|uniref:Outer membrane protein beta-barrel domain-containing protein n=1 Tax=Hymenobacter cellulosivorans TaxID=2932249 RepID=A0ABY4F6U1_9BACT|nr:hypothetical protein [Hymenobacter cellulosivorans]UOQ51722.1 hypothetical protein MUN80_18395 [Hymenobacter cellulosivorans]
MTTLLLSQRCYAQDEPAGIFRASHILFKGDKVRYLIPSTSGPKAKVEEQDIETTTGGVVTTITRKTTTKPTADASKGYEESDPKEARPSEGKAIEVTIIQKGDTLYFKPWKWTVGNPTEANAINNETTINGKFFRVVGDVIDATQTVKERNKATADAQAFNPTIRYSKRSIDVGIIAIPITVLLHQHSIASVKPNAGIYVGRNYGFTRYYTGGVSKTISRTPLVYGGAAELDLSKKNTPDLSEDDKGAAPFLNFGVGYLRGTTKLSGGFVLGWYVPLSSSGWKSRYSEAPYLGLLLSLKISG